MRIGIIAEDQSDVDVLAHFIGSLCKTRGHGILSFLGHGCGKLRRKCGRWAVDLVRRGCRLIIVAHDLDRENESVLRRDLERKLSNCTADAFLVLIPVREMEAWLLYDGDAIASLFQARWRGRLPGNPESLEDPKRELGKVVRKNFRRDYISTIHNARIAKAIRTSMVRARSFAPMRAFALSIDSK